MATYAEMLIIFHNFEVINSLCEGLADFSCLIKASLQLHRKATTIKRKFFKLKPCIQFFIKYAFPSQQEVICQHNYAFV